MTVDEPCKPFSPLAMPCLIFTAKKNDYYQPKERYSRRAVQKPSSSKARKQEAAAKLRLG